MSDGIPPTHSDADAPSGEKARSGGAITRKDFLKVAGAGAAGLALLGPAGCGPASKLLADQYLPIGGSRMNVVVVIIDSLRKDHVGAYGNNWIKTPNLDALAKESLRFTRPYPDSIPTVCARRAIHTGMRTWPFRNWNPVKDDIRLLGWQPIPQEQTTLAEILANEGYYNLFVTDTLHQFRPSYDMHRGFHSFHFIRGQERDQYKPISLCPQKKFDNTLLGGPQAAHATEIARQYLANTTGRKREEDWFAPQVFLKGTDLLQEAAQADQPFFMVVDNYDPHEPWDPPSKYVDLYDQGYHGPEPLTSSSGSRDWLTDRQLARMHHLYCGEATMADHWLGHFLGKFYDLGLGQNTLLLLLSDHGHAFGEHGIAGKVPAALYPELTDTVFMLRHPDGKGAGQTSDYYASTHDVAPTILGVMGIEPRNPMDGTDLSVIMDGKDPEQPRPHFSFGYHDHCRAHDERYAMISRNDGSEAELYDLQSDPKMDKDIAGQHPDIVKRMFNDYIIADAGGPLPKY